MFTWICPQCGREVPPSYNECPDCAAKEKGSQPAAVPPPPPAQQPQPQQAPPPSAPPANVQYVYVKRGAPAWLVTLLVAVVLIGAGAAAYYYLLPSIRAQRQAADETAKETAPVIGKGIAEYVEVTGLRIVEDRNQKPQLKFLVVSHSSSDISNLSGTVLLHSVSEAPGAEPIATIPFKVALLKGYEVTDVTAPLNTKLRAYELPDWQFLKATVQLNDTQQ